MPYSEDQKKEHIRELQGYLYGISLFDKKIPQILPNGVYDSETEKAVEVFQREYGLHVTGETNPETWNKIVSVYRAYLEDDPAPYQAFPSRTYRAELGDSGELIYIIQAMLWKTAAWYDNMPKVSVCGEYDEDTEKAVRSFQKCCGLNESGCVDCVTWNMLVGFLTVN